MPTPTAIDLANSFRAKLALQEADSAARMGRIYSRIYTSLIGDIDSLADEIFALGAKAEKEDIIKLGRMQRILTQVKDEAGKFGTVVRGEIDNVRLLAIQQGVDDSMALIESSLPQLPADMKRQIVASFTRLPSEAVEAAAGMLGDDSPLLAKLQNEYGQAVADQVEAHIIDGIAVGMNPRTIAAALQRNMTDSLGTGLNWVLNTVRTAQIKSYQTATHANYLANSRIVPEWVWFADLGSDRTCMSCVAKHGSVHPVTEVMQDHHSGRCAPIPKTISYKALGINLPDPVPEIPSGQTWFDAQPPAAQRQLMGPGKHDAYKAGEFDFSQLSTPYDDPVYGELYREATLKELVT